MKESKLVLIAGMSGAGKSTTAQQLAKQFELNGVKYKWLHEEIDDHPIREGEFSQGGLDTVEGMARNIVDMCDRWARLTMEIEQSDSVYIMEGCLYQTIIRYFFPNNYPLDLITEFYDRVMGILAAVNPTIVFLYKSDVKTSFEQAFTVRGKRWQQLILDPEGDGYFNTHEYSGDSSTFAMYEHYQHVAAAMFERYTGCKIKLCTSDGQWAKHIQQLTEFVGLRYIPAQEFSTPANPEQYCGRYVTDIDGRQGAITIKLVDGTLYCQVSWWSNMKLLYLGNHEFEVQSFPIGFVFDLKGPKRSVFVKGNYGWGISGKTLYAQ